MSNNKLNILCIRNLGDSFIQKEFIDAHLIGNGLKINIFCRDESAPVFDNGDLNVYSIKITPSIRFLFKWKELLTVIKILKSKEGTFVTFFGDWLELSLLTLAGVSFTYPVWPKSHYLRKILRIPKFRFPVGVAVDISSKNLYQSFEEYVSQLSSRYFGSTESKNERIFSQIKLISRRSKPVISFSPLGSVPSKCLSIENVRGVVELCNSMGCTVVVMCSENQKNDISKILRPEYEIEFCTTIMDGVSIMKNSCCYIGVDTFWTHVAIANKIPCLLFSGAIPAEFIYPGFINEVYYGSRCSYYPCFNFAPCKNKTNPFICIGSGLEVLVHSKVRTFLSKQLSTIKSD